jgi:hypothetical protein
MPSRKKGSVPSSEPIATRSSNRHAEFHAPGEGDVGSDVEALPSNSKKRKAPTSQSDKSGKTGKGKQGSKTASKPANKGSSKPTSTSTSASSQLSGLSSEERKQYLLLSNRIAAGAKAAKDVENKGTFVFSSRFHTEKNLKLAIQNRNRELLANDKSEDESDRESDETASQQSKKRARTSNLDEDEEDIANGLSLIEELVSNFTGCACYSLKSKSRMRTVENLYQAEQDGSGDEAHKLSDMDVGNNGDEEEENNKGIKEATNGVRCVLF